MNRLLLAAALWVGLVGAAWASTVEEQLLHILRTQGYVILEQGYTFLGRLRIVAQNTEFRREIVVNPGTGEILRDYATLLSDGAGPTASGGQGGPVAPAASGNPSPGGGVATVTGLASDPGTSAGVSGADTAVAVDPDSVTSSQDSLQSQGGGRSQDGSSPEIILVDPILPFTVEGQ